MIELFESMEYFIISIHLPFILYAFYDCLYQNQTAEYKGFTEFPTEIGCMSNLEELNLRKWLYGLDLSLVYWLK